MMEELRWWNQTLLVMPTWKWLVLIAVFAGGIFFISAFRLVARKIKEFIFRKSKNSSFWHHYLNLHLEGPVSWILLCLVWFFAIDSLQIPERVDKYLITAVKILFAFNLIRLVYIAVEAFGSVLKNITAKTPSPLDDQLAPMATQVLKVLVVILGALIVLQNFGVNVVSLLAGLGLGGLALALAAQDAVANLIGSVMIILDRPFSIGDSVKVADVEGTIEAIGFRSTRIRTVTNSLVTIPNSTMAKEKIDNTGLRPYRRIRQTLGIHYDTPPEVIEHFCTRVKYLITQDTAVVKDTVQVSFVGFADSSLSILVNFHLAVFTGDEESSRQQKIFCEIIAAAKEMGVVFAYPTQTVYYMQDTQQSQMQSVGMNPAT